MSKKPEPYILDRLAEEARRGRISRRDFMSYSIAAGLTATTAAGLWTKSAVAAPQRGGTFRLGAQLTSVPGGFTALQEITIVK